MSEQLEIRLFKNISLEDSFFNSLKRSYAEFPEWFERKAEKSAYTHYSDSQLDGFMYLKVENGDITDVDPPLPAAKRIKIGTLKIDAHGTKLGERFLKKAFDHAIDKDVEELYVTIFPDHESLINLLKRFGFYHHGKKTTANGTELVFVKHFRKKDITGNIQQDYPFIDTKTGNPYMLSINPEYHSQLFPDSILENENYNILLDVSHTNSISKTYVCAMDGVSQLKLADKILIYRTTDHKGPAEYRSVATSVCIVEEVRARSSFRSYNEYYAYTRPFSVLTDQDLKDWWQRSTMVVIKMLYNAALSRKLIRRDLADKLEISRNMYWGFIQLSQGQFEKALDLGGVNERLVIH